MTTTAIPSHNRKRKSQWWWNMSKAVDVMELQPLQQQSSSIAIEDERHQSHDSNRLSTTATTTRTRVATTTTTSSSSNIPRSEYRTLELVLGLDEPITTYKYNHPKNTSNSNTGASHGSVIEYIEQYMFPPDIPQSIQLWRYSNICIPISYLTVGIMQGMVRPLLNVYPLDLGATEAQQTMLASIATLPSTLKIIFGFYSDNVPIFGYRRKPYMLIGWILSIGSMILLLFYTDLSIPNTSNNGHTSDSGSTTSSDNRNNTDKDLPSMEWLMVTFFISGSGMWISDVMVDAFVAQKVPLEPIHAQGQIQSTCYALRFFGIAAFSPISTYLYSNGLFGHTGPETIVISLAIIPLITAFPLWFMLQEDRFVPIPSTIDQCNEIWKTVCSRAVWQPIGFVYLYNILQIPNAAWRQYLKSVLLFTSNQLNILLTVSYGLLYLGTVIYKYCFLKTSWRRIYYMGFVLNIIVSLGQIALISGYTFGLNPFIFALGDDALMEFIVGIQMLPICIMMVSLCPPKSEGASYAMFTTAWNSAMLLAQAIGSSVLLGIWDTSKETMLDGDLSGLLKLSILTTMLQLLPILFVWWLPKGRDELEQLSNGADIDGGSNNSSKIGGGIFLFVVFSSVIYTVVVTLLNVLVPGWIGES